jgi:hypothetical protein
MSENDCAVFSIKKGSAERQVLKMCLRRLKRGKKKKGLVFWRLVRKLLWQARLRVGISGVCRKSIVSGGESGGMLMCYKILKKFGQVTGGVERYRVSEVKECFYDDTATVLRSGGYQLFSSIFSRRLVKKGVVGGTGYESGRLYKLLLGERSRFQLNRFRKSQGLIYRPRSAVVSIFGEKQNFIAPRLFT